MGKPAAGNLLEWFRSGKLLRELTRESSDIDLQVVRAEKSGAAQCRPLWRWQPATNWRQYATVAGVLTAVGMLNALLAQFTGPRVPGFVYLLAVVLLALFLGRGPVLFAGAVSALAWNYFSLRPKFIMTEPVVGYRAVGEEW